MMTKFSRSMLFAACLWLGSAQGLRAEEVLTWEDCLREAGKNNPELISAAETISQEKSSRSQTASSLFPQIDSSLSASTSASTTTSATTGVTTKSTTDTYRYGVSASQLIFDGFKTVNNVNAASEDVKAAEQGFRFTSSDVRLSLRTAFISLLRAQELINVAEDILRIRRDNLILITMRYESGLEHKGALLTAEANLKAASFELSQAKRNVDFAQRQLNKEMGREGFSPFAVRGDFMVVERAAEKPDFDALVKANPALLQAAFRTNSAAFGIKSAYADFLPSISASAGTTKSSSKWPPHDKQWDAGVSIALPIFEGGLRIAQVSQAQSAYRQAIADERSVRDSAVVSLAETWADLQDALETVDVRAKSLEATSERSNIAQAQYSTGFINFDNWIIIEDDLVAAKKALLEAQANALLAEARWIQAKGEQLEYAKAQ